MGNLKGKAINSLKWKYMERISAQAVTFIVTLVLARLLSPSDYGVVAIILVFINLAYVFVQGGFNTALIQKKTADNLDFSTVLYFSLFVSAILYAILFFLAPLISNFYNQNDLIIYIRVLSIILFIYAYNSVQVAYVTKQLNFKILFKTNFISNIISGLIGIICAYLGLRTWSLIIQQILCQILICIFLQLRIDWRPTFEFSITKLKKLFSFGGRILASNLLVTFFLNIRSLLIGKFYDSKSLAFFDKGKQFPQTLMDSINGTIQTVMLPIYSKEQDDVNELKKMVRRSVQLSCYTTFPMMIGLAITSDSLIKIFLTDKWMQCVPFLQIFAICYMFNPLQTIPSAAIKALGKSKLILRLEIIRKTIELILLIISIRISTLAVAISALVSIIISCIISLIPNSRIIKYSYKEQIIDILKPLIISAIMAIAVYYIKYIFTNLIIRLIVQIIAGILIYIAISAVTKNEIYLYIINLIKQKIKNNKITDEKL